MLPGILKIKDSKLLLLGFPLLLILLLVLLIVTYKGRPSPLESYLMAPSNASKALLFNGSSGYIDTKYNQSLKTYTIEAWIKPSAAGEGGFGRIIEKGTGTSEYVSLYINKSGQITFFQKFTTGPGRWKTASNSVKFNDWNHIAVAYDAGSSANTPSVYVNGVLKSLTRELTPQGSYTINSYNYFIGNNNAQSRTFNGTIDEVRIWNTKRSQSQIKLTMNTEISPSTSGLVSYFRFDEGTGTTTRDSKRNISVTKPPTITWTTGHVPISTPVSRTPTLAPYPSRTPTPTLAHLPSRTPTPTLAPFPSRTPTPTS